MKQIRRTFDKDNKLRSEIEFKSSQGDDVEVTQEQMDRMQKSMTDAGGMLLSSMEMICKASGLNGHNSPQILINIAAHIALSSYDELKAKGDLDMAINAVDATIFVLENTLKQMKTNIEKYKKEAAEGGQNES